MLGSAKQISQNKYVMQRHNLSKNGPVKYAIENGVYTSYLSVHVTKSDSVSSGTPLSYILILVYTCYYLILTVL